MWAIILAAVRLAATDFDSHCISLFVFPESQNKTVPRIRPEMTVIKNYSLRFHLELRVNEALGKI